MKFFLKQFPLTIYATTVLLIALSFGQDVQYDSGELIVVPIVLIMLLSLPLLAIGQIYTLLGIEVSLAWVIPIFFLLDLLLLSIRKGYIKTVIKKFISKFY